MAGKKAYDYFEALLGLSKFSLQASELLKKTLANFQVATLEEKIREMHNIEHSADIAKHDMIEHLVKEFLPPIEREDIINVAQQIDDVTDAVEDVLMCIDMFNVKAIRPEILKFTETIEACCKSMYVGVEELRYFRKSKKLHEEVVEVNRLEEEGDALYINGVKNLYKNPTDPVDLMVWTEVYRKLEKCCDACEDVANEIESIVMKNS